MTKNNWSPVEKRFFQRQYIQKQTTKIPYILVDNFPDLGFLTSLRFLEWVSKNPEGVISLPTGKTPEYFIKWTHHFLFLKINIIQFLFIWFWNITGKCVVDQLCRNTIGRRKTME